jgi:hypothetical protein
LVQLALFFTFLALFILTTLLVLLSLFLEIGSISDANKNWLLGVTVVEVAFGILALFYAVFGLGRDGVRRDLDVGLLR